MNKKITTILLCTAFASHCIINNNSGNIIKNNLKDLTKTALADNGYEQVFPDGSVVHWDDDSNKLKDKWDNLFNRDWSEGIEDCDEDDTYQTQIVCNRGDIDTCTSTSCN